MPNVDCIDDKEKEKAEHMSCECSAGGRLRYLTSGGSFIMPEITLLVTEEGLIRTTHLRMLLVIHQILGLKHLEVANK